MNARNEAPAQEELPRAMARARYVRTTPDEGAPRRRARSGAAVPPTHLPCSSSRRRQRAEPVAKVLASAVANAENNLDLDPDTLWMSAAYVDEGPTLKRFRPRAQGRAYRIRKRTSHITVEVESRPVERKSVKKAAAGRKAGAKGGAR